MPINDKTYEIIITQDGLDTYRVLTLVRVPWVNI